jgi:hypothetical protein
LSPRAGTGDTGIATVSIGSMGGSTPGGELITFGVPSFTAMVITTPNETSSQILASLDSQLAGAGLNVQETPTKVSLISNDNVAYTSNAPGIPLSFSMGTANPVPEPSAVVLVLLGAVGLAVLVRRWTS